MSPDRTLSGGKPCGLIQVDSRLARDFGSEDIEFLRTYATTRPGHRPPAPGTACRSVRTPTVSCSRDCSTGQEPLRHRHEPHRYAPPRGLGEEARQELAAIGKRIDTLRLVHEQLYVGAQADYLPLLPYVTQLAEGLCEAAPHVPGGGGYDAAKRTKGRKRHIAVDTDRRLLMVNLTTADVQDSASAEKIVAVVRKRWPG